MTLEEVLKRLYGYDSYREGQKEIITSILKRQDTLAIMPTGAGKSICYTIPGAIFKDLTIIISPLISLMQDQVKSLRQAGIRAGYINSSLDNQTIDYELQRAARGDIKILFVAPERLLNPNFIAFVRKYPISMIAIDEAHCISHWGQDFRPSYLKIIDFIHLLAKKPVIAAFTATATKEVQEDIIHILGLQNPYIKITSFDRKNLYYKVIPANRRGEQIYHYIKDHINDCGIIYCQTRKNVEMLYEYLSDRGIVVSKYHGGMDNVERYNQQNDFIFEKTNIMIATNAFGMGIDKSNVRYVLHYNIPLSMEDYYQEAGRAGRDGLRSECILYYSKRDIMTNQFLLEKKEFVDINEAMIPIIKEKDQYRLRVMERYCTINSCLRHYILEYFDEDSIEECNNCGNCDSNLIEKDVTKIAKVIIKCLLELDRYYGISMIISLLKGSKNKRIKDLGLDKLSTYGLLNKISEDVLHLLIDEMITQNMLGQTRDQYPTLYINDIHLFKDPNYKFTIKIKEAKKRVIEHVEVDNSLFRLLKDKRLELAKANHVPPYIIFNDKTLLDLVVKMPTNNKELLFVHGIGVHKVTRYGKEILEVIETYKTEQE